QNGENTHQNRYPFNIYWRLDLVLTDYKWTVKANKPHYGYNAHAAVDMDSERIRGIELTSANVGNSVMFNDLIQGDEQSVFADKGYYKQDRKHTLRHFGILCGILDKAHAGHPLSAKQKKRNKRSGRIRSGVERLFGVMKRHYGMS
ncbi:transposase, partial [Magnetococcus sp. PR-3]|uniref:transposase n=1 Tax=Magnetococcus sp. PR-3 TaxID=3120355 RepID=UPI002FCE3A68